MSIDITDVISLLHHDWTPYHDTTQEGGGGGGGLLSNPLGYYTIGASFHPPFSA